MPKSKSKNTTQPSQKVSLNSFGILKDSWQFYRSNFRFLWLVAVTVAVPANILQLTGQNGSIDLSYIGSIAALFMVIAIMLVVLGKTTNSKRTLATIYNQASSSFLRYIGLSVIIAIMATPMVLSLVLAIVAAGSRVVLWPVVVIGGLVGFSFFVYALVRFSLSSYILLDQTVAVWQSLRLSWRTTKGKFWKLFMSYLVILILILVLSGAVVQLFNMVPLIRENELLSAFLNGLLVSVLLPFLLVYVGKVYAKVAQ